MRPVGTFRCGVRRAVLAFTALLLAGAPLCLRGAEEFALTPAQLAALEATRKGFGKGKKLQAEVERLLAQCAETNRVQLGLKLAAHSAEKWPGEAPDALGKLVQLLPAHAVPLLHAALKTAPKEARALAAAAMTASPTNTVRLASAALQIVPTEGDAILEAAAWRVPKELKTQLDQLRASLPPPPPGAKPKGGLPKESINPLAR